MFGDLTVRKIFAAGNPPCLFNGGKFNIFNKFVLWAKNRSVVEWMERLPKHDRLGFDSSSDQAKNHKVIFTVSLFDVHQQK